MVYPVLQVHIQYQHGCWSPWPGALINDTNTSPVLKTATTTTTKIRCHSTHGQKYSNWDLGSSWATQHRAGRGGTGAALLSSSSTVQREEEEEASPKRLLGLKCLRLKRKQDSLGPRSSSSTVRRSLQTELTCIYRVHSLSVSHQHVSTTADITEHGRIIYRFYMWTANSECVTHTHTHTPVTSKFMAKKKSWSCIERHVEPYVQTSLFVSCNFKIRPVNRKKKAFLSLRHTSKTRCP